MLIDLTKKEFDLLLFLAINKDKVLSKESIAEHLWGDYIDSADSFDFVYAHIKNLRKKLIDNGVGNFLTTVYGVGYKFSEK
jgi:DNA-binding response OmpR family regulator